jgi:1-acyl-sn-glycerol-3-phosphate acyltransferase
MFGAIMYFILWVPLQLCRRALWRWSVEGLENLPPPAQCAVLAANHLSWLDIPILGASLPLAYRPWWVAKIEVLINRPIAWWMRQMRVIPIRRGKRDIVALTAAEELLKRGEMLVIFPEGHRSDTGALQEGRGGAVRLVVRSGCPLVPIAIWGTETGLRGALLRKPIHVRIGEPFYMSVEGSRIGWNRMNALTEEMMLRIAALIPRQYWGFYSDRMLQIT